MPETVKLEIRRPDVKPAAFDIVPGVYFVGSDADCQIQLAHPDVESRHAILTVTAGACAVEDLASRTGTRVDGRRIAGRVDFRQGQNLQIGPFTLVLKSIPTPVSSATRERAPEPPFPSGATNPDALLAPDARDPEVQLHRQIKQQIHGALIERLQIKRLTYTRAGNEELRNRAESTIVDIVNEVRDRLPPGLRPEMLVKEIVDEALGLGPLEEFLSDPTVTEVMVNGPSQVYVEKAGRLTCTGKTFMSDDSVLAIIERIVSPIGRRIDESQPYVDARLPDGSRVNAIIPPLSLVGPCLTIRKFSKIPYTINDMIRFGSVTRDMCRFAEVCVRLRKNIVVSGGTGSGKTTLLNMLGDFLPATERIVTIEDAAELRLAQAHVVRLEARPPNIEGKGEVTIRDLVRNALRMRPDRIVVGECRGGETLDMLQAMNTGHDGSLTTVHANSPRDVISRLETMVLMSGMDLPVRAIREQIAAAVHLIIHISRFGDGSRKVTRISEIVGLESDQITMQDIFEFVQTGMDSQGKVLGYFRPTGSVPTFLEEARARGLSIDHSIFDPQRQQEREP